MVLKVVTGKILETLELRLRPAGGGSALGNRVDRKRRFLPPIEVLAARWEPGGGQGQVVKDRLVQRSAIIF